MSDIIVLAAKQSNTKSAYCLLVHSHPSFRLSGDCMHGAGGNKSFTGYYMRIYGIPFLLEACLLVWMSVALTKRKGKMLKVCGVFLLLFCVLSPFVSSLLAELPMRLHSVKMAAENGRTVNFNWGLFVCVQFSAERFFKNAAVSAWPLFKTFTMLMYALIAFCPRWQIAARHRDRTKRIKAEGGTVSVKSKVVAALLAFFLGETGAHRYYLGYRKQGAIQTCGLVSLVVG